MQYIHFSKTNRRYCVKPHAHALQWERLGHVSFWQQQSRLELCAHAESHLGTPSSWRALSRLTIATDSFQNGSGQLERATGRRSVVSLSVWGDPNFSRKGNQHFFLNPVRFNCFLPPKTEVTQACNRRLAFPITPHKVANTDQQQEKNRMVQMYMR